MILQFLFPSMKSLAIFVLKMRGPSSTESKDTGTCILFKLTSCGDKDIIWDFSLLCDYSFTIAIYMNTLYFLFDICLGIVIDR